MTKAQKHPQILSKAYGIPQETLQHVIKLALQKKIPLERLFGRIVSHAVENKDLRWCMKTEHTRIH